MPFFVSPYEPRDIAFLGTSITANNGYVAGVKSLILGTTPFYSLEVLTNLGEGGATAWYSLARLENVVSALAPDVVCLEHVVNDDVSDFYKRIAEAIIRRIRSLLPAAHIVFIATPRVGDVGVDDATNLDANVQAQWKTICDHYGVSTVDWSAELVALVAAGGHISTYMSDTVHPTAAGHTSIAGVLKTPLISALGGSMPTVPDRLYDCADYETTPIWRNGTDNDGETGTGWSTSGTIRKSSTANDTIKWSFTGVSFGFYTGTASGVVGVTVDGGTETTYNLASYGNAINDVAILANAVHEVVFRVVSGTVEMDKFISI